MHRRIFQEFTTNQGWQMIKMQNDFMFPIYDKVYGLVPFLVN